MKGPAQKCCHEKMEKARRSAGNACGTILLVPACQLSRWGFAHPILPRQCLLLPERHRRLPVPVSMKPSLCPRTEDPPRRDMSNQGEPRVFGLRTTAAGGALAGTLDPGYVLASLGLIWAACCAAQLFNPYLLRLEDEMPTDVSLEKEARPPT
jgi:hypothetical protein